MSKKKVQRPFSIDAWEKGAPVETRDGRKVRIVCTDAKLDYCDTPQPILGLISEDDEEHTETWTIDGCYTGRGYTNKDDLVIVEEVEEPERWADDEMAKGGGWTISRGEEAGIYSVTDLLLNEEYNYDVFATEKQAKSALAMARISQLMAHDERYGGVVTDEEWRNNKIVKLVLYRSQGAIACKEPIGEYHFLAFHTAEQRDLFLAENEQLIKDYLMID